MASITEHTWITAKCHNPQDDAMVLCQITCKNEKKKYQGFHEILEMVKDFKLSLISLFLFFSICTVY